MSKEKKFHNLIEKDGREEKKRVWEKIQADDNSAQPLSVEKEQPSRKTSGFFLSRKFLSWAAAAAFACILFAVGVTRFIPQDGDASVNVPSGSAQTSNDGIMSIPETGVVSGDDMGVQGPCGEANSKSDTYAKTDYTEIRENKTLATLNPNLLRLNWDEIATVDTVAFVTNQEEKIIAYQETYTPVGKNLTVILQITAENVAIEEFFDAERLKNTQTISGVSVHFHLTQSDGQKRAYAYFIYKGNRYYAQITEKADENTLTTEYLFGILAELLP